MSYPSSSSHNVPDIQLSSPADYVIKPQVNSKSEPHLKVLPDRITTGNLNSKSKYPISNYVSYHILSMENKAFVNQLSSVFIPNSVQEVLKDAR